MSDVEHVVPGDRSSPSTAQRLRHDDAHGGQTPLLGLPSTTGTSNNNSNHSSGNSSTSLSLAHIQDAVAASLDGGQTIYLTNKNISDVGEDGAEQLAMVGRNDPVEDDCIVTRLALSGNKLSTLPIAFPLLSRLRYLNLKSNNFVTFPSVLITMPSLEILDISRNKIKRLPKQPGSLVNLRVLSLSRNKLTHLPAYLADFSNLHVLKVNHNPIEWPPKSVIEFDGSADDPSDMRSWISGLQTWMRDDASGQHQHTTSVSKGSRKASEESFSLSRELDNAIEDSSKWARMHGQVESDSFSTPHARSFSIESEASVYSDDASGASASASTTDLSRTGLPRLRLGALPPSISTRHVASNSPDSYLPTPDASVASGDEMSSSTTPGGTSSSTSTAATITPHLQNSSYAESRNNNNYSYNNIKRPKRVLHDQMSMPDLRTVRVNFGRATATKAPSTMTTTMVMNSNHNNININMRSGSVPNPAINPSTYMPSPVSSRQGSASSDGPVTATAAATATHSSVASTSALPSSMDGEYNRYFRRHSSLPSAATTAIPKSLLSLMDAARSLLFAISQIYQSLQQLTYSTNDARMISILRKVLDPAYQDMVQLIHRLDRFDDAASRSTSTSKAGPTVSSLSSTTRAVIESSRDAVASFGRVVSVVALQLRMLARAEDDVRFLRQTLLMLYGAAAELGHAWHGMAPHIEAVKGMMQEQQQQQRRRHHHHHRPHIAKVKTGAQQSLSSSPTRVLQLASSSGSAVGTPELASPSPPSILGSGTGVSPLPRARGTLPAGPNHAARRHAGSFSFKDVEIGKSLPSIEPVPPVPSTTSTPTPMLRSTTSTTTTVRHVKSVPSTSSPASSSPANSPLPHFHQTPHSMRPASNSRHAAAHSRQGSLASLVTTTSSSSSSTPPHTAAHSRIVNLPAMGTPGDSRQVIDKQALDAMKAALEAAPAVWEMIEELLSDDDADGGKGGGSNGRNDRMVDLREDLDHAKRATDRLREDLFAVQRGDPDGDRRSLRDNAHVFVKAVVNLSKNIKDHGGARADSAALRSNMVKLTNATEELLILLHVSSFSPSSTPRPYSPMPGVGTGFPFPHSGIGLAPAFSEDVNRYGTPSSHDYNYNYRMAAAGASPVESRLGAAGLDNRLGSSLSRSRSAQPAPAHIMSSKHSVLTRDVPRSALPHQQSFRFMSPPPPMTTTTMAIAGGGHGGHGMGRNIAIEAGTPR